MNGTTTKDRLIQMVTAEPNKYTRSGAARVLGVSRERVRKLGNELGIRHLFRKRQWSFLCADCGKRIYRRGGLCQECHWRKHPAKKVKLVCGECGKEFERNESKTKRSKDHYCNRICFGRYAGKHYGLGTRLPNVKEKEEFLVSELEFSVVSKAFIPRMMHPEYSEVLDRCTQLSGDEALKVKCPSLRVAEYIKHMAKARDFVAVRRTDPTGIFVYISKK